MGTDSSVPIYGKWSLSLFFAGWGGADIMRGVRRREFIRYLGLGGGAVLAGGEGRGAGGPAVSTPRERAAEVVVAGGGLGGVAAALAAARAGRRVILTEETDWIGGQLTSQAVPPDEHPWIESFGCTCSYRDL